VVVVVVAVLAVLAVLVLVHCWCGVSAMVWWEVGESRGAWPSSVVLVAFLILGL
jgi:hypothetical protein